jgi:type IV fimbrial biogenesis protein FimT
MKNRATNGFTLIELMLTLAVAGVLIGIAAPNFTVFMKNNRLSAASNDLLRSFQLARTEAIKRQKNVVVCASSDTTTCSYGSFSAWIVFEDDGNWQHESGEPLLEQHNALDGEISVYTDNDGIVSYMTSGFAAPPGASGKTFTRNIAICDDRGNTAVGSSSSTARAVLIDGTGRVRTSKNYDDVTAAGDCK